jgi:hypothetical protein
MINTLKLSATYLFLLLSTSLLIGVSAVPAWAQEQDSERRFWPPSARPAATTPSAARPKVRYRRTSPALSTDSPATATDDSVLGITIWLVAPPAEKEKDGARILTPKTGKKTDLIAKRVEASTKFTPGQKVRLSIEAPRSGHLYIIDREQYADGTFSDPYLIYPLDPVNDDNRVTKGRVFEIPNVGDDPYFEVKTLGDGKAQIAEQLTVLITPTPLKELPKAVKNGEGNYDPVVLPRAQVEEWEKQWATQMEQAELEGGAGQLYTTREQTAGFSKKPLTQADPLPQTVFRVAAKPGKPLLVKLPLQIGK